MDVRQTVTQLYRDYESGNVANIMGGLPDNFRFEWESDRDTPPAYTQAHHITWWNRHRGPTDLDNGVLLCSFHHHLVHDSGWGILVRDHRVWFVPPASLDPEQRPRPGRRARRRELAAMPAA